MKQIAKYALGFALGLVAASAAEIIVGGVYQNLRGPGFDTDHVTGWFGGIASFSTAALISGHMRWITVPWQDREK